MENEDEGLVDDDDRFGFQGEGLIRIEFSQESNT